MNTKIGKSLNGKKRRRLTCDCGRKAELVTGKEIYPHRPDLYKRTFWLCRPCDAYVGCHKKHHKYNPNGDKPFGILANKELRDLKVTAHRVFDPLWQSSGMTRTQAYRWLAYELQIPQNECHFGLFDKETINRAIKLCLDKHTVSIDA